MTIASLQAELQDKDKIIGRFAAEVQSVSGWNSWSTLIIQMDSMSSWVDLPTPDTHQQNFQVSFLQPLQTVPVGSYMLIALKVFFRFIHRGEGSTEQAGINHRTHTYSTRPAAGFGHRGFLNKPIAGGSGHSGTISFPCSLFCLSQQLTQYRGFLHAMT